MTPVIYGATPLARDEEWPLRAERMTRMAAFAPKTLL